MPLYLVPHPGECVPGRDPRFQLMARFTAPGAAEPDDMQLVLTSWLDLCDQHQCLPKQRVPRWLRRCG